MVEISVIIVSYNSREFLKNSIKSVYKAAARLMVEVIVIDNCSGDGTMKMIRDQFPEVICIGNKENKGYSVACNQGIRISRSPYILVLNPDTLVREDCLEKCLVFARSHSDLGAMGVKMYDGSGKYLPESKRGFPYPLSALWKITGVNQLFPRSAFFNHYYLGHLSENESHEIDVLTGAFMFIPKPVLEDSGLFDEDFFMYGEDIDLSYRIQKAGFKIYYLADTCIVHYKGISTQRGSFRYVRHFYRAMLLFAKKHFSKQKFRWVWLIIHPAIYLRAGFSFIRRVVSRIVRPALDLLVFYIGMMEIKDLWSIYYFRDPGYYDQAPIVENLVASAIIYLTAIGLHSGYKHYQDLTRFVRSVFSGLIFILILYALLPMEWRSSRAMILFGAIWFFLSGIINRLAIGTLLNVFGFHNGEGRPRKIMLVGLEVEIARINQEIELKNIPIQIVNTLEYDPDKADIFDRQVREMAKGYPGFQVDDILICLKDFPSGELIRIMTRMGPKATVRVIGSDSLDIIGSSSRTGPGYLYSLEMQYEINKPVNRILKRLFDIFGSLLMIICSPVLTFTLKMPYPNLIKSLFGVLLMEKSLVGYHLADPDLIDLPKLRKGIFSPSPNPRQIISDKEPGHKINIDYALNYSIWKDVSILVKNIS